MSGKGLILKDINELYQFAASIIKAGIRRNTVNNVDKAACIIQAGAEVGLAPMASIQCMTIKGDVPTIDGEGMLAIVKASEVEEWTKLTFEGEGQQVVGHCETKRVGCEPVKVSFSYEDARKAGLLNRGLKMYEKYPQRMYPYRAAGFCLRDVYTDVIKGLHMTEEMEDVISAPTCKTPKRADRDNDSPPENKDDEMPSGDNEATEPTQADPATILTMLNGCKKSFVDIAGLADKSKPDKSKAWNHFIRITFMTDEAYADDQFTMEMLTTVNDALNAGLTDEIKAELGVE